MAKKETGKKINHRSAIAKSSKINTFIALFIIAVLALIFFLNNQMTAATVNGEPIYRLTLINELEKQGGKQILEQLITKTLILQEARKRNLVVREKEIDEEVKKTDENLKKNGQNLSQLLVFQGLTMEEFRQQTKLNLIIRKMVNGSIVVSDREVDDYIKTNAKLIPKDTNPDDIKKQTRQRLEQQKLQQKAQELLKSLREKAKINYLIKL